ncbi:MAG: CvpA family protein [Eubacteriales bacterium]|nr:CvpA family protein [Eubacteriales bacterium]
MKGIGLLIDIIFALTAIIIIVVSTRRGFIRNIMRIVSFVLSIIIAATFCKTVAGIISSRWLDAKVSGIVGEQIASLSQKEGGESYDLERLFDTEQSDFMKLLQRFGADVDQIAEDYGAITAGTEETVRELSERISHSITDVLSRVLAFLGLFLASILVLSLISWLLGLVARLPVLKQLNGFLGFLCGVILAAGFLFVFSTVGLYLFEQLHAVFPDSIPESIAEDSFALKHFSSIDSIKALFLKT